MPTTRCSSCLASTRRTINSPNGPWCGMRRRQAGTSRPFSNRRTCRMRKTSASLQRAAAPVDHRVAHGGDALPNPLSQPSLRRAVFRHSGAPESDARRCIDVRIAICSQVALKLLPASLACGVSPVLALLLRCDDRAIRRNLFPPPCERISLACLERSDLLAQGFTQFHMAPLRRIGTIYRHVPTHSFLMAAHRHPLRLRQFLLCPFTCWRGTAVYGLRPLMAVPHFPDGAAGRPMRPHMAWLAAFAIMGGRRYGDRQAKCANRESTDHLDSPAGQHQRVPGRCNHLSVKGCPACSPSTATDPITGIWLFYSAGDPTERVPERWLQGKCGWFRGEAQLLIRAVSDKNGLMCRWCIHSFVGCEIPSATSCPSSKHSGLLSLFYNGVI